MCIVYLDTYLLITGTLHLVSKKRPIVTSEKGIWTKNISRFWRLRSNQIQAYANIVLHVTALPHALPYQIQNLKANIVNLSDVQTNVDLFFMAAN